MAQKGSKPTRQQSFLTPVSRNPARGIQAARANAQAAARAMPAGVARIPNAKPGVRPVPIPNAPVTAPKVQKLYKKRP